ncbi:MAG: TolC family protein [Longimonas sp.]|uniref:TolC family protein n=1 Tax=Longimonas sp. TaxID=2039626 RepID=UPI00334B59E6
MNRFYLLLASLMMMGSSLTYAQAPQTLTLSVDDAVSRAQAQNYQLQQVQAGSDAARAEARQTLATFLPQLSVGEDATSTTDPLNAFGFQLKQSTVTEADFAPQELNDPDRIENFTTRVEVRQPIFNAEGIYERRAATRQARASQLETARTAEMVRFRVRSQYYGLVLARERRAVVNTALEAARSNASRAEDLLDQGMINQADLLEARVRVLELDADRTEAQAAVDDAVDQLRYLLGIDEQITIEPSDSLPHPQNNGSDKVPSINASAVNADRSDMQALRLQRDAAQQRVRAARAAFLPTLNAQGGYEWNDTVPFGTKGQSWTVGISLRWNVFSGFEQVGGIQRARANQRASELAVRDQALQNEVEINAALRALRTSRERVAQTGAMVEQARESFRLRSDRFEQGLESTTDLLNAEAQRANSQLAALQARYSYAMNRFRIELLTEQTLQR